MSPTSRRVPVDDSALAAAVYALAKEFARELEARFSIKVKHWCDFFIGPNVAGAHGQPPETYFIECIFEKPGFLGVVGNKRVLEITFAIGLYQEPYQMTVDIYRAVQRDFPFPVEEQKKWAERVKALKPQWKRAVIGFMN